MPRPSDAAIGFVRLVEKNVSVPGINIRKVNLQCTNGSIAGVERNVKVEGTHDWVYTPHSSNNNLINIRSSILWIVKHDSISPSIQAHGNLHCCKGAETASRGPTENYC